MLKLWRYTTAYQGLLPVQQQLQRHRSSMAALRPIFTALQDFTSGQQLHAKLQQQLQPRQQLHQQQQQQVHQQQQHNWAQLLAQPSDALVQQLHNQLPGVPRKALLQLLRLLSEAVAGLDANITADMLQQMLHALDHPGSFQPVAQQQDDNKQQLQQQQEEEQQTADGITTMRLVTVKQEEQGQVQLQQQQQQEQGQQQEEQQQEPQVTVTAAVSAAAAEQAEQKQQTVNDMQVDDAAPSQAVAMLHHTSLDMQLHTGQASQQDVRQQQQQQAHHMQQQQAAPAQATAVGAISDTQTPSSQDAEDEPYSPTRHAEEVAATAAAAAAGPAAALAGVGVEAGSTSRLPQQEPPPPPPPQQQQQQQPQKQLVGAKRVATDGEQLQQPRSKKAATPQAGAAATSSKSGATAAAAKPSATDGQAPAAAPAGSAEAMADAAAAAQPAAEAPDAAAAAVSSKPKLPGESYALTLFDDLRFSLQQLGSAKAVVDTRGGRLVQLAWYLQVDEALHQRLPSEELALKFLAKFPGENCEESWSNFRRSLGC
jgi:hypothetical protein